MIKLAIIQSETRIVGGVERITQSLLLHPGFSDLQLYAIFTSPGKVVDEIVGRFPGERMAVLQATRLRDVPNALSTVFEGARLLKKWGIDVTLSQNYHAQCYGGPASWLAGARNIFWSHGTVPPDPARRDLVTRFSLRVPADCVLAYPTMNIPILRAHYRGSRPVELCYPAVDLAPFLQAEGGHVRAEFGIPEDVPVATVAGRLQPWKGQDVFVKAAAIVSKRLPQARFLVVGGPTFEKDEPYAQSLKQLAQELNAADRIVFTGHRGDMPAIMAASDVVVHSSVEPEPFGLVIPEAMAAGKPVIASRAGGPAEVIIEGKTGFLTEPRDHEALADKMTLLLSDRELRAQIGAEARRDALARFSLEALAKKLEGFVKETVGKK